MGAQKVVYIMNVDLGIRIHMRTQMCYLLDHGYEVWAVCSPGALIPQDEKTCEGIKVKTIPMTQRITLWQDFVTLIRLARFLRQEKFDIVHTHTLKASMLGRIAARLVGTPVIIHTIHGFYFHDEMPPRKRAFWKFVERVGMWFCDHVLSQNHEDIETAIESGMLKPDKITYLGNGIKLDEFDPARFSDDQRRAKRAELGVPDGHKVVAISGRLVVEKGYQEFIQAARLIHQQRSDVTFWAMGACQPDRKETISTGVFDDPDLGDIIHFLGMRSDMAELYAAMDIFVLPSHGREGIPRVVLEASTMGVPIVATNVRGCREAVIPEETGLLIPPKDADALADAILRLLDDEQAAQRMGAAARAHALRNFDEEVTFARILAVYHKLLKPPSGALALDTSEI